MENLLKDMGKRIFDRRKQLNMTQETLAELAHVTPQTISTAELGQKAMRPETILKVCDALHISTEYLLRGVITEADSSLLMKKNGRKKCLRRNLLIWQPRKQSCLVSPLPLKLQKQMLLTLIL